MFYWLLKIAVAAVVASELKADIRGKPDNTTWCHAIQFVQEIFQKKSYCRKSSICLRLGL